MNEQKTQKKWLLSDKIVLGIQFLASLVFALLIKTVLPFKFWIAITTALALINIIILLRIYSLLDKAYPKKTGGVKNPYRARKRKVKTLSIFMSVVLILVSLMAGKGLGTLKNIAGEKYQTKLTTILVQTESSYETIKDLEGKTLGLIPTEENNKILETIKKQEKISLEVQEYSSPMELAEAILGGNVDSVLFSEAFRGLVEDSYGNFSTDTRILYEFEEKEEVAMEETDLKVSKEAFNVFISGIDTYGKVSNVSRSDVNMIVTVNPKTKQILMTSIPRDYHVELASFGAMDKLTHAGIYGVGESMETLENLFDIELHYYAKVNFTSLVKIVDALGGINVYNDQAFTSYHTHDYYPKGDIYMDGETALEFVRERYGLANGDNDRVKNQQKVLKALINKAISPAIIKNFSGILDAISGSVSTSMDSKDIQEMIQMQISDMASWDIQQISVEGRGTTSTSCYSMKGLRTYVMEPNYETVRVATAKINEIMNNK